MQVQKSTFALYFGTERFYPGITDCGRPEGAYRSARPGWV
jgi:hypothetical protein